MVRGVTLTVLNLDHASTLELVTVVLGDGWHHEQRRFARATLAARRLRKRGRIAEAMEQERRAQVAYNFLPARLVWL